jgi:hypothetical protein
VFKILQIPPVGVSSWQHILPEGQVEVVEDVGLGLRHTKRRSTDRAKHVFSEACLGMCHILWKVGNLVIVGMPAQLTLAVARPGPWVKVMV